MAEQHAVEDDPGADGDQQGGAGRGVRAGQIALAWLLAKAPDVVPIPGTLHVSRLEENTAAAELTLTGAEIARLDALEVAGEREIALGHNWFDGVTPPLGR